MIGMYTALSPLLKLTGYHFAELITIVVPWWAHEGSHSVNWDALTERGYDCLLLVDGQHIEHCSFVTQFSDSDVARLVAQPYNALMREFGE